MGLIYATIRLRNYDDILLARKGYIKTDKIRGETIKVLVDTGASMLAITEHIKNQLGLNKVYEREVELADGRVQMLDVVGPIEITFENRVSISSAFVLTQGEPLLGAIPMEEMDVVLHPQSEKMIVNPESPYIPKLKLK
ncbi:MAG: retroviral-like aspartic protease family protein [Bacteroidota bacterium]